MVEVVLYGLIAVSGLALGLILLVFKSKQDLQALKAKSRSVEEKNESLTENLAIQVAALDKVNTKASALETELSKTKAKAATLNSDLGKATESLEQKTVEATGLFKDKEELAEQLLVAERKIVDLAARPDVVLNEMAVNNSNNATALWKLELLRSERAWRNSVATNPVTDESPFTKSEDPVRLAIETDAAALREDVGAYVTIDWKAKVVKDPARSHLIVRVAQELLAAAARTSGPSTLVVSGSKDLKMKFEQLDDSAEEINLIAPRFDSEVIDITDKDGITVTVKA